MTATPKLDARQARRLATVPMASQKTYTLAVLGQASPRTAIKAMCQQCMGYERASVAACESTACPLHPYRPYRPKL